MQTLCLGEALVDLVCGHTVSDLTQAETFEPRLGGAMAAVAVTAARRGAEVALAGAVGDDAWGGWVRAHLGAEGVALDWLAVAPDAVTPLQVLAPAEGGGTLGSRYGPAPGALGDGLGEDLAAVSAQTAALVVGSGTLVDERTRERAWQLREHALEAGRPVIVHPAIAQDAWRSTSAAAEVVGPWVRDALLVSCTESEALALTGELEVTAAATSLRAAGAAHVVVGLEAGGALLRGTIDRDLAGAHAAVGGAEARTGVLLAALARTGFYAAALAAMLPDAVHAAAHPSA